MGRNLLETRKEVVSVRFQKELLKDLNAVAKFNNNTRTGIMERYIRDGLEKSKRLLEKKYVSYSIMILTLLSIGLYIWMVFNM